MSVCVCVLVAQSCLTLCNSMDCSPPGSSIHGILQARILEWVAILFFSRSSRPRDWTCVSCSAWYSLPSEPGGKPTFHVCSYFQYVCTLRVLHFLSFFLSSFLPTLLTPSSLCSFLSSCAFWHSKFYKCMEVIKDPITDLIKICSKGVVFCHTFWKEYTWG